METEQFATLRHQPVQYNYGSAMPISQYVLDYGYVCAKCNSIFEFYADCEHHIKSMHANHLFIAIRTYDRVIYEQEHVLDKFRQERMI
jgi:hypothetical protein